MQSIPRTVSTQTATDTGCRQASVALRPRLMAYALSLGAQRADAEDLVNETCVRTLSAYADRPMDPDACRPLLFRILLNLFRDNFRRRRDGPFETPTSGWEDADAAESAVSPDADPATSAELSELMSLTRRALGTLSPDVREAARLYYLDGRSCRRIAAIQGVPAATVASRLARGRRLIRRALRRAGIIGTR